MNFYELSARYDSRQSFYGKAQVAIEDGGKVLYSYNTKVAKITEDGIVILYSQWDCSGTTLRHVKEFLKQETSFFIENKKDIQNLIKEGKITENNYV